MADVDMEAMKRLLAQLGVQTKKEPTIADLQAGIGKMGKSFWPPSPRPQVAAAPRRTARAARSPPRAVSPPTRPPTMTVATNPRSRVRRGGSGPDMTKPPGLVAARGALVSPQDDCTQQGASYAIQGSRSKPAVSP